MKRAIGAVRGAVDMFGGTLAFWLALYAAGLKAAIAVTVVFVALDLSRRAVVKAPKPPPIYFLTSGLTLAFGAVDLYARTPFMIRYEAAVVNMIFAAAFAISAFGRRPLVMQFARRRRGSSKIPFDRPEMLRFFKAFTLFWAAYMVLRAVAALWLTWHFPLTQALAMRAGFSWISFALMMTFSLAGRRVFEVCQRLGFFQPAAATVATASIGAGAA